jgi:hypothetical protein
MPKIIGSPGDQRSGNALSAAEQFAISVLASMYDDDPSGVKWIYTGERCTTCGILGSFSDWKVALTNALGPRKGVAKIRRREIGDRAGNSSASSQKQS